MDIITNDISLIFKSNLKIDNMVKSIGTIFLNSRFREKINYKPYFQRNYVWDIDKASYFIESIFLGTEIPPIVMFDNGEAIEVIDGRQRYETILKFMTNEIELSDVGVKTLKSLVNNKYCDLSEESREAFDDTKIRILMCSVLNEPELSDEKEDKIKKEIFKRYNSGIIPLKKEEIQRAEFIDDQVTIAFSELFNQNLELLNESCNRFLSGRARKSIKRDKVNKLVSRIRVLVTLPFIPINNYANSSTKYDHINIYYNEKVASSSPDLVITEFNDIMKHLNELHSKVLEFKATYLDTILFYETNYWIFGVLHKNFPAVLQDFKYEEYVKYIIENDEDKIIFESTGSHFHKTIKSRYRYVADYFESKFALNMESYFANTVDYSSVINRKEHEVSERKKYKLNKPEPTSMTIEDILKMIKKSRFMIRPEYQRSEVSNKKKSSYLIESIMLGIKIPPIFVFKREDKVYEVVDGQQRLLSIIGFLGEEYLDETGEVEISAKHKYKLENLKILSDLNGKRYDTIKDEYPELNDRILDFQLEIIEIDGEINPNFDSIDLFLRLNTKPFPIGENTFEMWNSYIDKELILMIRNIAEKYTGTYLKPNNNRMVNEELIVSLAYINHKVQYLGYDIKNILNIYVKSERVNARITRKSDVTKILDDVSKNGTNEFIDSIKKVEDFFHKIEYITDGDYNTLRFLFGSDKAQAITRTNQNYYILWMLLEKCTNEEIKKIDKKQVLNQINNTFRKMKYFPESEVIDDFVDGLINYNFR